MPQLPSLFGGPANFAPFTWGVIAGIITFILEKAGGLDRLIK